MLHQSPRIRRWLGHLLHTHDTPQRTAAAYALGVFFGFSPFLGLHTILALVLAFALNLNRVAVLLGVYSNLPWILPAYYTLATVAGAALLRVNVPPGLMRELTDALTAATGSVATLAGGANMASSSWKRSPPIPARLGSIAARRRPTAASAAGSCCVPPGSCTDPISSARMASTA
jgi:hypothetical protein